MEEVPNPAKDAGPASQAGQVPGRQPKDDDLQKQFQELSRLEELLRRPDYVLEPGAMASVRKYMTAGGKAEVVLESLAEGCVGYAHMAMLMVKWNEMLDEGEAEQPPTGARQDEYHYLKEFVKSKFDPDKISNVFARQSAKAQAWVDGLLSDARGRQLIYELSAAHRNSLCLNFAIQKIMKNGYQDEVAAAGSALASYFSVFHKLLANKLEALVAAVRRGAAAEAEAAEARQTGGEGTSGGSGADVAAALAGAEREVSALVKELRDSCEQSQHTYLHVQHVLRHLGGQAGGEALLAVAQRLEAGVAEAAPGAAVWGMQRLYASADSPVSQLDACHLIGRMLAGATAEGPSQGDVLRLHAIYSGSGGGVGADFSITDGGDGSALSTAPLRHPRLLQALLASIFTPSRPPSPELLSACAHLLALATATPPEPAHARATGSRKRPRSQQDGDSAGADSAAGEEGPQGYYDGGGGEGFGEDGAGGGSEAERAAAASRVSETTSALHWAVGLLARSHGRMVEEDVWAGAPQLSRLPVVAHGLLHALGCSLGSAAFFEDAAAAGAAVPVLLRLSLLVAASMPSLVPKVLSSWSVALAELQRGGQGELCRMLLDAAVALMREAAAAPTPAPGPGPEGVIRSVLELVEGWGRQGGSDAGLLRYFVLQVLGVFVPPYPASFCGPLLRLLLAAGVRATNVRGEAQAALLREFAAAAEALGPAAFSPQLTPREQHLVAELAGAGGGGAR